MLLFRRKFLVGAAAGASLGLLGPACGVGRAAASSLSAFDAANAPRERLAPFRPRFGRARPLVAVAAVNAGTEMSDFIVPFGVLARSGVADVVSVAMRPGPVNMRPLSFTLQSTLAAFDDAYPEGADYVIVPNVGPAPVPALEAWVAAQAGKGASLVSICLGALIVARTGLMDGRRATSYFFNEKHRLDQFPAVKWQRNIRYVADGDIISSAGISASMPVSVALVEAIAGRERADALARELGLADWSSRHDSDVFQRPRTDGARPGQQHFPTATLGIPVRPGDDEIALGLLADAYGMTGEVQVMPVAETLEPVRLAHGLLVHPKRVAGDHGVDRIVPPVSAERPVLALDRALTDITANYGAPIAEKVAWLMEYPGYPR